MSKQTFRKYWTLLLLATGAGIIYQLPYIRETFYVPLQNAMNLTNAQMGLLSSGYATMATISYFLGGIVADKYSARKLLTFSFLITGILGLYFSTFPGYTISRIIFVLLGISTIITYWSALVKATRMLGESNEQGRLFGLQEGLRGIMNAILVFGMMAAFNSFSDEVVGTAWAIRVCAIVVIIIGILNWFFIEDTKTETQRDSILDISKGMLRAMKIPRVWVLCGIVFTAYSLYGLIGYIGMYVVNVYGAPVETSITLGGVRYIIQGFGGVCGGFLADKIGSRIKVILGGVVLFALCFLGFFVLPAETAMVNVVIANFIFGMFLIYIIRSLYFAIIDDANIDVNMTGRVSGFVSCLGYTPDIFMYTMVGGWIDTYAGKQGYNMMFLYGIAMAVLCLILGIVLSRIIKKDKEKLISSVG